MFHKAAHFIIDSTSAITPFSLLQKLLKIKLIFPYYHIVNDEPIPHVKHLYQYPGISKFERDLEWITKHYKPVSLETIIQNVKSGNKHNHLKNCFHLTFDDGFREIKEIIAPILSKKGIPATFFINTAFLDNQSMYYRNKASLIIDRVQLEHLPADHLKQLKTLIAVKKLNYTGLKNYIMSVTYDQQHKLDQIAGLCHINIAQYLKQHQPYLFSSDVQNLIDKGFTIGAHSIDHPLYKKIPESEQFRQTHQSTSDIQQKFKLNYRAFAFPNTDKQIRQHFFDTIYNKYNIDVTFGTSGLNKEKFRGNYQRIWMENTQHTAPVIIKSNYLIHLIKKLIGIHYIKRA